MTSLILTLAMMAQNASARSPHVFSYDKPAVGDTVVHLRCRSMDRPDGRSRDSPRADRPASESCQENPATGPR